MKKILLMVALLIVAVPVAQAGIREGHSSDVDFLMKTNYSEATARIVDTIRARNNYDEDVKYERVYNSKYPTNKKEYMGNFYSRVKAWFDPMADDHFFGEHEVNFDNKFFQMEPSYRDYLKDAKEYNKTRQYESL